MRKNMRHLAKYVLHICGIYAAYAAYMRHISPPKPVPSQVEKGGGLGVGLVTSPCKTTHTTETARGNHSCIQTRQGRRSLSSDDAEGGSMTDVDQSREEVLISKRRIFNAKSISKIGTWNVRTLYQRGIMAQVLREMQSYRQGRI